MATEYYLIKPDKKEMYCLGVNLKDFSCIRDAIYRGEKTFEEHADYQQYECSNDFLLDVIKQNPYFMDSVWDEAWGTIVDLLGEIWEFIQEDRVLKVSDVIGFDFTKYKEIGSVDEFFARKANNLANDVEDEQPISYTPLDILYGS